VVGDGGRQRRRLLRPKVPGDHLVEVRLVESGNGGAVEDDAVVVVEGEVVVGEVGAPRPDLAPVEDQVLVVQDAAVVLVVDDGDAGGFQQDKVGA
jgi:hypothetical protein